MKNAILLSLVLLSVAATDPEDPEIVAATIIDGNGQGSNLLTIQMTRPSWPLRGGRVVTFSSAEDSNSILSGFTITGGNNGIYCTEAAPTIANCTITGNTSTGIKLYSNGSPAITNCSIVANSGAGIEMQPRISARYTFYNRPQISNCIIAKNTLQGMSGGIPAITNSTIAENLRGGIYGSRPTITNSIIYFNGLGHPVDGNAQIAESAGGLAIFDLRFSIYKSAFGIRQSKMSQGRQVGSGQPNMDRGRHHQSLYR